MYVYFILAVVLLNIHITKECALPFWWTQQYHFQPDYRITGQPKTTYRYRSMIHQTDPNNFVHVQEYSEYTWWEHNSFNTKETTLTPGNIQQMTNVIFSKDGSINGIIPGKNRGLFPRGGDANDMFKKDLGVDEIIPKRNEPSGMVPKSNEGSGMARGGNINGMVPKGSDIPRSGPKGIVPGNDMTFGMNPISDVKIEMVPARDDINGMILGSDVMNGMIPTSDAKNGFVFKIGDTNEPNLTESSNTLITTETITNISFDDNVISTSELNPEIETISTERERNEKEDVEINKVEDLEGNDLETSGASKSSSELKIKEPQSRGKFFGSWFGHRTGNESEPCKVTETDIHSLRSMIEKMFSKPREHEINPESKEKAREDILNKFRNYGLQVWTQNFTTPPMKNSNGTEDYDEGVNLVGVIPGAQRGKLDDEIVLVGAHYDTVPDSNGVDDNGSGLAVMLEVARAITEARCRLNHTLMFVAFDHEENGAMGSNYFVDHYLIPEELKRARARFQGAFILDGIMNYNDIPNTQELPPDYTESLPGFQYFVNNTGNRGNFLAMISRNEMDNHLTKKLMDAWQELGEHQYKLYNLAVDMGNSIPDASIIQKHLNFLRSDHATFWYHNSSSHFPESLNAVLLTDTGPFRGQMKECYHNKCDDLTVITPEKLQFAKKTADALTATLVELTTATAGGYGIRAVSLVYALIGAVHYITQKFYTL